jgi:hypothetical protein
VYRGAAVAAARAFAQAATENSALRPLNVLGRLTVCRVRATSSCRFVIVIVVAVIIAVGIVVGVYMRVSHRCIAISHCL